MNKYTGEDRLVWKTLFDRQVENLNDKVCSEYKEALWNMRDVLNANEIPDFTKMNKWFEGKTGWKIKVVPGLIPVEEFFTLLAEKQFCSSTWLRTMEQLDYLEEPDMFHDTFGHVPLLSDPVFSDFMQCFGELGCRQMHDARKLLELQRLYWFTVEFGMTGREHPLIYGAGILSSFGETLRAMSEAVVLTPFSVDAVTDRSFHTDRVQEDYVRIDDFRQLFKALKEIEEAWSAVVGN